MLEGFLRLFSPRPALQILRDTVDVMVVAFVIYRALLIVRGTRAMQMAAGLAIVFLVYLGSTQFGLVTLHNLLSWLLGSAVLLVVVIFQNDIRRALIRMGGRAFFASARERETRVIDEVVAAATELARHRMGALIAFEQDANLLEFTKSEGTSLDAVVTRELLVSLFIPESVNKLHDGAVLIRDLKIARAGVFFPMPDTKILDSSLGSRHRAALGITEETDAVVVVVSEERGTISFCFSGNIVQNLDAESLRTALLGLFGRAAKKGKAPAKQPPKAEPAASPIAARTETAKVTSAVSKAQAARGADSSATTTPRPASPAESRPDGRSIPPRPIAGTIRAPEARPPDSDREPDSDRPSSATSTPLPLSEGISLRSESRLMPPARSTFLSLPPAEPDDGARDDGALGDEP